MQMRYYTNIHGLLVFRLFFPGWCCGTLFTSLRDWSLITGRGGATKREGGHVKFYLYEKGGGAEKVLAMLKGGAQKV